MKFDKAKIKKLVSYLQSPKQVVIVTHPRPDGDALGSSLGLKMYLEKLNHTVTFITPTDYTKNLSWIPGTDSILTYESNMGKKMCEAKLASAELLFCLDFNAVSRLEDLGAFISASKAVKIVIDHHQQPEDFAEILFSDTSYCATAEMVYDILCDLGGESLIDDKIAECLYTGIATDNGFFQFSNTTPNSLRAAAALVEKGAKPEYISEKVNNVFHVNRLRYYGYCLHKKMELTKDRRIAYMLLSKEEIKEYKLNSGDSEGLVNYPFKIEGVVMSCYFSEENEKIKISFRSRGDIDVNEFARKYFEGGGHKNAAGGKSLIGIEETKKKFLKALKSEKLIIE